MAQTNCGFLTPDLLTTLGPTLKVDIGFDPKYRTTKPLTIPTPGIKDLDALVDTGAAESCIDNLLATQLNLPIVDRRPISGAHGSHDTNMYLAQIHVPSLRYTIYGVFAGVDLKTGGQMHSALIGRTFLQNFTMIYNGLTGVVTIST